MDSFTFSNQQKSDRFTENNSLQTFELKVQPSKFELPTGQ
jgi:hypothetical protein